MKNSDHITEHLPHDKSRGYSCPVVDTAKEVAHTDLSCKKGMAALPVAMKSEGEDHAAVGGCNANNANAGRTLNANNSAANGNDNFAVAFAGNQCRNMGKENLTSRPTRSKNEFFEGRIATSGCGSRDYDFTQLPFWDCYEKDKAESEATICQDSDVDMDDPIWQELKQANRKRNLKGLSKFYESMTIATYAVRRTCKDKDTKKKIEYYNRAHIVAAWMIRQITRGSYHVIGYRLVDIPPRFPSGKHRDAKVFTLYDRCVQMFVLVIIENKLRNKVVRNNYSNIEGRGIYCNDKRYCMANAIRTATWKYPNDVVLLTDIRKFYDNVSWKVMLGVVFETVKDRTTRWLIYLTLKAAGTLPIGSCLSPLFADILMNDYDRYILSHFDVDFFGAFGDNRCFFCCKSVAIDIQQFTKSFYEGRYNVQLKGDYQIKPLSAGFSFCRKKFEIGFVQERGEIKRRAIRVADKPQSFAGYYGMFKKTDSKHLLYLLKFKLKMAKDSRGMEVSDFAGADADLKDFGGQRIAITNYRKTPNGKESQYYYKLQFVAKEVDGTYKIYCTSCGRFEIKQAGDIWTRDNTTPPIYVTVVVQGKHVYFKEYHTPNKEVCDMVMKKLNVEL